jgi:hypothetical protein
MIRKYLYWAYKHQKRILTICACGQFLGLVLSCWGHDDTWVAIDSVFLVESIIVIHYKRNPPDDHEPEEDMPDTPNGDAIDQWLKEKSRI